MTSPAIHRLIKKTEGMNGAEERIRVKVEESLKELDRCATSIIDPKSLSCYETNLVASLKKIRNLLVGNPERKLLSLDLNILPRLLLVLESGPSVQAKVLTVSLISSLASFGQEASIYFDGQQVFPCCINLMKSSPAHSLAGPLFILFHKLSELPLQDKEVVFMDANFASFLELFGNLEGTGCSESRGHLSIGLANCCQTPSAQKKLYNSPIKDYIANMLFSDVPKHQEAALGFFSILIRENKDLAASLISYFEENGKSSGFEIFLRHSNTVNPIVQFLALNCLVNFYCDGIMAENVSLFDHIIPSLIKLLKKDSGLHSHRSNIPLMLIYIIAHDANVLEPMRELGTIKELSNIFLDTSINEGKEFLIENLLLCMSTFAADSEPSRLELVENPTVLTRIIQCISHRNQSIKIAACKCIKSLSRSVHILRKYLADADPVKALHPLLESPNVQLQSISCATLCNIILNFSSMKETLIRIGALEKLTNLSLSLDVEVRRSAILALKNLLFQSSLDIKKSVLSSLGVKTLKGLLKSDDLVVELNAVAMLRNLVCGNAEEIDYTLNFIGQTAFLDIISEKLCKDSAHFELTVHALYTLTNMATGSKLHKDYIIARRDILNQVVLLLGNPDSDGSNSSDVRVACLWTIINLTWNEDDHFKERIRILCQLGVDMKLKQLVISESISFDVRDRAKTAFNNFPSSKLD